MKFTSEFNNFLRDHVNLNQTRLDRLDDHVEALEKHLRRTETLGPNIHGLRPQGSWAHKTIIRPQDGREFDADVLLELAEVERWEPKDYIAELARAFRDSNVYRDKTSKKTRCVRIQYAGQCHIDVVPFVRGPGGGSITNRHDNTFEATDPEGFTRWYQDRNRTTNGHLKRVIRLMKYLRDIKATFSVKSVILTALLGERVNAATADVTPELYADVPTTLKTLVGDLADYLDQHPTVPPTVADPSRPDGDFNHRWEGDTYPNFVKWIRFYADKIAAAHQEEDRATSMKLWREVFGDDFGEGVAEAAVAEVAADRAPNESFITDSRWGIRVARPLPHTAHISCRVAAKNGFRDGQLADLNYRVQRDRDLYFQVEHDVPAASAVYWKVRNRGGEAERAGDLRGEITRDNGSRQRRETTKYRGSHYVEVYVVKNGVCLAISRCPVHIV